MDFKSYYLNQATGSFPVFEGVYNQRGYGLGGIFRKLFKWVMPIVRKHAIPVVKTVGNEVIKGASNLAKDAIKGKNIKESAQKRLDETLNELSTRAGVMNGEGLGSYDNTPINRVKKRKLKNILKSKTKKKRLVDIFS